MNQDQGNATPDDGTTGNDRVDSDGCPKCGHRDIWLHENGEVQCAACGHVYTLEYTTRA